MIKVRENHDSDISSQIDFYGNVIRTSLLIGDCQLDSFVSSSRVSVSRSGHGICLNLTIVPFPFV